MPRKTPALLTALHDSLRSAPVAQRGTALAALAKAYAAQLDSAVDPEVRAKVLSDLGPKYLASLQALGLTSDLRSASGGAAADPRPPAPGQPAAGVTSLVAVPGDPASALAALRSTARRRRGQTPA